MAISNTPINASSTVSLGQPYVSPDDTAQDGQFPPLVAAGTQRIAQLVRMHLGDLPTTFNVRSVTDGVKYVFELPFENVDSNSFQISLTNGTPQGTTQLTLGSGVTLQEHQGTVTFTQPPAADLFVVCSGVYFRSILPGEMDIYIRQAYLQHTYETSPTPQLDPGPPVNPESSGYGAPAPFVLPEIEEYPLSLQVAIMILEDRATDLAQQMDVRTPDGVAIPVGQLFSQVRTQISALDARYNKVAGALNVGLYRIQVFDLRRQSYTTNRYVPQYRVQEVDDMSYPQRVIPRRDATATLYTTKYNYVAGTAYSQNDIVFEGSQEYVALQNVPSGAPDPVSDVNPATGYGYYWAYTTINSDPWWGVW